MQLTEQALRDCAVKLSRVATRELLNEVAAQLNEWADDLEHAEAGDEKCEGCDEVWLAEDQGHTDVEGVRLCDECWTVLIAGAS